MKVLFYFFDFPIYFFGLMICIGILAGIYTTYLEIKRKNLDIDAGLDIVLFSIIAAVIGARLFYILFYNPAYYIKNPAEIIMINEGGLSIHGGLISAFAIALIYMRKKHLSFLKYSDAMAPGIILGQAIGRVGCDVFGKAMNIPRPWGIPYQGFLVHPTQVYEFLLDYLAFFILWNKRKNISYDGQIFVWYLILFSVNRSIVELFRINPAVLSWISVSHILSGIFILLSLALMYHAKRKKTDNITDDAGNANVITAELAMNLVIVIALAAASLLIFYSVQS